MTDFRCFSVLLAQNITGINLLNPSVKITGKVGETIGKDILPCILEQEMKLHVTLLISACKLPKSRKGISFCSLGCTESPPCSEEGERKISQRNSRRLNTCSNIF